MQRIFLLFYFFFQAEDGIRVIGVTGVQTCALPISSATLLGLKPPLGMTASYLVLDGLVLELLAFSADGATAPRQARTMNEPGLTHLSLSVDDVRATAERAVEHGGQIVDDSDIGYALFIRDPDGQLVEL